MQRRRKSQRDPNTEQRKVFGLNALKVAHTEIHRGIQLLQEGRKREAKIMLASAIKKVVEGLISID